MKHNFIFFLFYLGPVYEEECYCPQAVSVQSWLKNNFCDNINTLINQNLANFHSVNFDDVREALISTFNKPKSISICHYVIKENNVIYLLFFESIDIRL